MEAEEAKAKLEMESNTIPERLATKLNVDFDLIGPIEADRGDPYALQVTQRVPASPFNISFVAHSRTQTAC